MCGICGFYTSSGYGEDVLKKMNDSLTHRGPDDHGEEIYSDSVGNHIGLGHRRLSILDLTANGHQPMKSDDERYILVYNGEIYNFIEIREELEAQGISFKTRCDTEVLLKAYIRYGIDCLDKFNGMFALAIFDRASETVTLVRDRMGVKPLYYYLDDKSLVWGSELKPITLYPGFHKELRTDILSRFFCHDYICSPDTVFENTYKVEPGQYVIYHGGRIEKHTYWDLADKYRSYSTDQYGSYEEAKRSVLELTEDAVRKRMIADVPVGVLLSGGIDSSLVTAIAQKYSATPVRTYTIGFDTKEENEALYARDVAHALGTDHTELYIGEKELFELLKDAPVYYDEPFADPSLLPTMLVSKLARQDVAVVLSGDGGDELYCGYPVYDWVNKAQRLDKIGAFTDIVLGGRYWGKRMPNIVYSFLENRDRRFKTQFVEDAKCRVMGDILINDHIYPKYDKEQAISDRNWQVRRMLLDMTTYLPDDILCKVDRASMKYSLESRNPLIDYRLVENSFRIPHEFKYYGRDKKHILKDIAYDHVDRSLLDRPKQGFGVPLALWLRTYLKDELKMYSDPVYLKRQGLFNPDGIQWLTEGLNNTDKTIYSTMLWAFYVFQRWFRMYMEDIWA